ncbi:glucuronate isomerase [Maribacter aestuarii]|uniref:glucuronate isomerase n=1 Tax=Maribacter aestuarii TaxID=1130723 RepID=UPI0025A53C5E|nr:glucuronate isomerase [Maribacter aestuarii]
MNTSFISDNFLLTNRFAEELYHQYAAKMPIIDYHNHLSPKDISDNRFFPNITKLWIDGDHYKWRAIRTLGISEKYVTGNAGDAEKFMKWAETVPYTVRNPLYHWTHLELNRYFNIDELLTANNAKKIYDRTSEVLSKPEYSCQSLISKMNVELLCTTEDPTDNLKYHRKLRSSDFKTKVTTAFRPDRALQIEKEEFNEYLNSLEQISDKHIHTYQDLCDVLRSRIGFFHENGCKLSDHGLEYVPFAEHTEKEVAELFKKRRGGDEVSEIQAVKFKTSLLIFLSEEYHSLGWVQQFHLGALRNNNSRKLRLLGPDTGWDSIGDWLQAQSLSRFLNRLDSTDKLTKTIIYNLNPRDNEVMASMIGNFNDGSVKGKIQFGSGWWFLDQKDGMEKQLNALSNIGLISCFIGMLTDSRSFLSFPRHEYFRRILCNLFGQEMANGQLPQETEWIGKIIQDICYYNAKAYFNF